MGILTIDLPRDESHFAKLVALSGVDFEFRFDWNQRESRWYLSIYKDGDAVHTGIKIVADWPLVMPGRQSPSPAGLLMAVDTTGVGTDPGLADLGARVQLCYFEADD